MERTSSAAWVRGLAALFTASGLDAPALFAAAAVPLPGPRDPDRRYAPDEITRLWELAVERSGNPLLGVDRQLAARHIDFELLGFAMLSCPTLGAALEEFARYLTLLSSATFLRIERDDGGAWLVMGHAGNARPIPPQRSAYSLLALVVLAQWAARRDVLPRAARFGFAPPGDAAAFQQAFGCPVAFSQPDHRLFFAAADLALPLPGANAELLVLHERAVEERLAVLSDDTIVARVTREVQVRLPRGEPKRPDVARALGLADRTLQRRLAQEGTSFQQLLDDVRRDHARRDLSEGRHSVGEVAYRLGFADASTFQRACRRWFGCGAAQVRARLASGRADSAGAAQVPYQ